MRFQLVMLFGKSLARLPKGLTLQLSRLMSYILSPLFSREKQIAEAQLELMQKRHPNFPESSFRDCLEHALLGIFELFNTSREKVVLSKKSAPVVEKMVGTDCPILCLSAHYGNFELLAGFFGRSSTRDVCVVAREANLGWLQEVISSLRREMGVETICRGEKNSAAKLRRAIRKNNIIGLLIDQDFETEQIFAPFFGIQAGTVKSPLEIAVKFKTIVCFGLAERARNGSHILHIEEIEFDPLSDSAEQEILDRYNKHLEEHILRNPNQWLWWHRRWRRQPQQTKLRSNQEYLAWLRSL